MRVVFAGTPEIAVPSLRALVNSPRHEVVAVLTRPDARIGRGRSLSRSPVGAAADAAGLEVLTPPSARDAEFAARLADLAPDAAPVVAYGNLVPPPLLGLPTYGWINLHFSLLPAWRGAAPVNAAIAAGDDITGASTFRLEEGLDTGPVFGTMTERIRPDDTAGTLLDRLADGGAGLLVATLDAIEDGTATPVSQPTDGLSHAPKISTDDARVRWSDPLSAVDRHIRSVTPAPGAWTELDGARLKVGEARIPDGEAPSLAPGALEWTRTALFVGTATGALELVRVQPPGKKMMAALDWVRGARLADGTELS